MVEREKRRHAVGVSLPRSEIVVRRRSLDRSLLERSAGCVEQLHLLVDPCLLSRELTLGDPVHREVGAVAYGAEGTRLGIAQPLERTGRDEALTGDGPGRE